MDLYTAVTNSTLTENGAETFKSTLSDCLDLFSMGGASRNKDDFSLTSMVLDAWGEDRLTALKILFYLRDIRGGVGEKRIFREGIKSIAHNLNTAEMMQIIPEIGSWKDVFEIYSIKEVAPYIKERFLNHIETGKYDLMEKWMPSIGGSKNKDAEKLAKYMGMTPKEYRKALSKARESLKLVETSMCNNDWQGIEYSHVPSKAMLNYRKAFWKHDEDRMNAFINAAKSGDAKINAKTLFPYEITKSVIASNGNKDIDTLDVMWKNLKDYKCEGDSLVVADTSGSMTCPDYLPISVATSLAIYFAERNVGKFKDTFITFSSKPSFVKINREDSIKDKVNTVYNTDWGWSTDLEAVFDMILTAARRYELPEEEMPKTLYIISDMEFNACVSYSGTLFENMKKRYAIAGYKLPNVIFWNVNSRQSNVPVTKDENGVALVSGCSPSIFEMVASNGEELNPMKVMNTAIEKYSKMAERALI